MNGNKEVGITGELSALIKLKENKDYSYFITWKSKMLYSFLNVIFPKKVNHIMSWRLNLSKEFDKMVKGHKIIIDLGAGYSLRGFELCKDNLDVNYFDVDFNNIIKTKESILKKICREKQINLPNNYKLISGDILNKQTWNILNKISSKKDIILISEGVVSYFSYNEFNSFMVNIKEFLKTHKKATFFSHDKTTPDESMAYKIIRLFISLITINKAKEGFKSKKELASYFKKYELKSKIYDKNNLLFYEVKLR